MANRGRDIGLGIGIFAVSLVAAGGVAFALGSGDDDGDDVAAGGDTTTTTLVADGTTDTSAPTDPSAPSDTVPTDTTQPGAPVETAPTTPSPDGGTSTDLDELLATANDAGSCEELADGAINFLQSVINEADGLSLEELQNVDPEGNPAFLADYEAIGTAFDERAVDLGCSDAEMEALVCERAPQLTAEGLFGESVRGGLVDDSCGA
ncbi:MAG: hypothetical protein S0880_12790 [Actinomycetota bacterium]|nr:hypothetical protein [Actinomycetota bacterium]